MNDREFTITLTKTQIDHINIAIKARITECEKRLCTTFVRESEQLTAFWTARRDEQQKLWNDIGDEMDKNI